MRFQYHCSGWVGREKAQMVSRQDQLYLFSPGCLIVLLCQSSLDSRESLLVFNIQCQKLKIGVLLIHNSEWYCIVQQTVVEINGHVIMCCVTR